VIPHIFAVTHRRGVIVISLCIKNLHKSRYIFFLRHPFQNGTRTHPASYPMGTGDSFLWVERPWREADHLLPSSAKFKNAWSKTYTPPHVCMVWCLVKHGGKFTFYLYSDETALGIYRFMH